LASVLLASGSRIIVELTQSIQALFDASRAAHIVQMHAGPIDKQEVEQWATGHEQVEEIQIVEMLNIENSQLFLTDQSELGSVMDVSFVTQNEHFDFLLNLQNEKALVNEGEIAVPIFYKSRYKLEIGDKIMLKNEP